VAYGIVVDASVARAASPSPHSSAQRCWECLEALDDAGHSLVMTRSLMDEWLKREKTRPSGSWLLYASRWAYAWLTNIRQRRRVLWVHGHHRTELLGRALDAVDPQYHTEVRKDLHLVESALATDKRILSLDRTMNRLLGCAARKVPELCVVLWVHPVTDEAPQWLSDGAPDLPEYHLGNPPN